MFAKGGFAETIDPPSIGHKFVNLEKVLLCIFYSNSLLEAPRRQNCSFFVRKNVASFPHLFPRFQDFGCKFFDGLFKKRLEACCIKNQQNKA